ncbi:MAG: hypothetical protein ACXWCW_05775, partial [Burkholderiales bacterium]
MLQRRDSVEPPFLEGGIMGGHAARLLTYVFTAIVALALTGCAGVGMAPGSGVDDDRFVAAIDTDDV